VTSEKQGKAESVAGRELAFLWQLLQATAEEGGEGLSGSRRNGRASRPSKKKEEGPNQNVRGETGKEEHRGVSKREQDPLRKRKKKKISGSLREKQRKRIAGHEEKEKQRVRGLMEKVKERSLRMGNNTHEEGREWACPGTWGRIVSGKVP